MAETASPAWTATVLTLYPEMFPGPLGTSLAGRALEAGTWEMDVHNIRDHAHDRHRTVDDTPAGGGPGMVMRADVLAEAIDAVADRPGPLVYLTPRGVPLSQGLVREMAAGLGVRFVCGRFEGLDERLFATRPGLEVSLGDFVLSGGEMAALTVMDACVRLLPGVMGADASGDEESFENGLLEYPHYTRPQEFNGMEIPAVLTSGHHEKVRAWRLAEAERITRERRPDLWAAYVARTAGARDVRPELDH
ncbi:tRNA (guanosine(37)-N1)-methyltransferase TrmD [Pyruvatibacter mobilis]|uniref:tRNA (guanosine(37)-N1)-methyltransferase TrmD n=1 Tax=Pyruvatibacter mobilis TaxID=1712261 RepID=UPI003BB0C1AA